MNIAIIILSIINIVFIYYSGIKNGSILGCLIKDIFGTLLIYLWIRKSIEENEKILSYIKWGVFIFLIISLIVIIYFIIRFIIKEDILDLQVILPTSVPFCLTYFILLIKEKLEDNYII